MLPDFPDLKRRAMRAFTRRLRERVQAESPILPHVRQFHAQEGDGFSIERADGSIHRTRYRKAQVKFTIDTRELPGLSPAQIVERIDQAARDMSDKISRRTLDRLREDIPSSNVVDGRGRAMSFELFMEAFDKLEIDFRDDGTPQLVALVSPDIFARLQKLIPEWTKDVTKQGQFDALMARKRGDWRVREARRKLVD